MGNIRFFAVFVNDDDMMMEESTLTELQVVVDVF